MQTGDSFHWPLDALPRISTAGRFGLDDRAFDTRYLGPTHALHVYGYHATFRLGDRTIALRPGNVTISPAGIATAYDLPTPGFHWCAHFFPATGASRRADPAKHAVLPYHFPLGSLGDHAGQRIMAIARLFAGSADPVARAGASAAMLELLLWLAMQSRTAGRSAASSAGAVAIERAAAVMQERLAQPLSIEELAEEVGLTQNYLARLFRRRFGTTMPHFLLTCRMNHAKHLLQHTTSPVAKIAERVGMPDPQHFNKQFRRLVGVSPSAYRRAEEKEG